MKKLLYLIMAVICTVTICACANQNTDTASGTQGNFVQYSCEEDAGSKATAYIQLDINPSFILGLTANGRVVSIEANNEDAEDVMVDCLKDYFNGVTGGVELEYVLTDLAKAIQDSGYIEDELDVSVTVLSGNPEGEILEDACERAKADLAQNAGIEASFEGMQDDNVCDLCNGEGTMLCDLCNGEGTVTEIEEHEVEVRNDYVCPYCGGVGILDDGLHGGETAVCGHCGGEGKTGSMSGDFREKAFDTEIVEEEVIRPCSRCDGSGIMPCPNCEGTGIIE